MSTSSVNELKLLKENRDKIVNNISQLNNIKNTISEVLTNRAKKINDNIMQDVVKLKKADSKILNEIAK